MFDTLTMSVEIFSLVTFVMQFFNSLLMLLLNINAMFLHMLKVKLKRVIVNELLRSVSFFLQKFSSSGFLLYLIHPVQIIWFMQSRMTSSALVLISEFESRCLAFYMAYYAPSVEENSGQNKCICIFFSFHFPQLLFFFPCSILHSLKASCKCC